MSVQISLFAKTTETVPIKNGSLTSVLSAIREGFWKTQIEYLRALSPTEYSAQKRELLGVTFSATFSERKAECIINYSKHIVIDVDHLSQGQIKTYKEAFPADPFIYSAFVSPSGEGLKILFRVTNEKEGHKIAFAAIKKYLEEKYAMDIDPTGKDLSRLCYVSYDPDLYLNENAELWDIGVSSPANFTDQGKWTSSSFLGKKVSTDVQYIFNVAKKWVERTWQCVPGSYNNYMHGLSCILNRVGVTFSDTMFLLENNFILPDTKWHQSVKSAYFHNKHEHNTVPIFVLAAEEPNVKPVPEEKEFSQDHVENDIIKTATLLLDKYVDISDVKNIVNAYTKRYNEEGFVTEEIHGDRLNELLNRALNNSVQSKVEGVLDFRSPTTLLGGIVGNLFSKSDMTTGFKEFDEILGGGPKEGCFYGLIGMGGTYKSIIAQNMAIENAKNDIPVLVLNMEMSSKQFFERLMSNVLKLDLNNEILNGRISPTNYHEYSDKIETELKGNLFTVTGSGVSAMEIINTINTIKHQTGKKIKMIICDGLSQMSDVCGNEILSAISNSATAKEIAKKTESAFIALVHTSGGIQKHYRDTSRAARGGTKIVNNMDAYLCTSLLIDEDRTIGDDIIYRQDKMYLRLIDKRNSGEQLDKILQISRPMEVRVTPIDPRTVEVDLSK